MIESRSRQVAVTLPKLLCGDNFASRLQQERQRREKNLPTSRDCGVGMLDTTEIGASSSNKVDNRETL